MKDAISPKLFLFDLDGTIYHDSVLIGDAKNTLKFIRENDCKIVYLTNNSSCTKVAYEKKLRAVGVLEKEDIIYSSLDCAVDFLKANRAGKKIYSLATKEVRNYLTAQGLFVLDNDNAESADILLLTFDKELDYDKIVIANRLLVSGKEYISTHPDTVCPTCDISIPDAGSFMEMFKSSSGRMPDIILGKPYAYMANYLLSALGEKKENTYMVGDRLYTDIMFGINAGIKTITVLSGETTRETYDKSGIKSDYLLKDINEIPKCFFKIK